MQVSDLTYPLLISHELDSKLLLAENPSLKRVKRFHGLDIFELPINLNLSERPGFSLKRYLDKFYLWTSEDAAHRQTVLDSFFQLIANDYESLIDIERNLENIRNLLRYLSQLIRPFENSRIVDYGCGTGLSIYATYDLEIQLIGVDRCPTMRQIAIARGMTAWSPGQLARQTKGSLDGAFASYVFHLLPKTPGLRLLWSRLREGGTLVGNFHKEEGLESVEAFIQELGGVSIPLLALPGSHEHGTYRAYKKK